MAVNNSEKLQETKEELQQEIDRIENMLDNSLDKVKTDVSSVDPRKHIQKRPIPSVSLAVLIGFLLAKKGSSKKQESASSENTQIGSTVWKEVKRRAARIAVTKAGDYLEDFLSDLNTKGN